MKEKQKRMVVVTTDKDRRGVFFGELISKTETTIKLKDAQMAIHWSNKTKGVLGLASIGPQDGSRISPVIPQIELNGVTSIMDCTKDATEEWRKEKWS